MRYFLESLVFLISTLLVVSTWWLGRRLAPVRRRPQFDRWLLSWGLKGFLLPVTIWLLMNLGISFRLQPFMPEIQAAQNQGGNWFPVYFSVAVEGYFLVCSYWAALTLAWMLWAGYSGLEGQERLDFKSLCWTCLLALSLPALLVFWMGDGWPVLGLAAWVIFAPMAHYGASILIAVKAPPLYSAAVARIKFGKYPEAEWEILQQLEKYEDDFQGWMMLAELYANQFHDFAEAERTILEICEHPTTKPPQLAIALHRLADWQLKLRDDPEAARRSLQIIADRLSGTHLAKMAVLRQAQLPHSVQELHEQRSAARIPLPALGDKLEQEPPRPLSRQERQDAATLANDCVEKLQRDPNDVPARERLARLMAERLEKPELGIEQLGLLLALPGQSEAQQAEWLSLTAAWQLKYLHDLQAGRLMLERLVREFPQTPQALAARRRIQLMKQGA